MAGEKQYTEIQNVTSVFIGDNDEIVVLGVPEEDGDHNCDYMGCGSCDHVVFRGDMATVKTGW